MIPGRREWQKPLSSFPVVIPAPVLRSSVLRSTAKDETTKDECPVGATLREDSLRESFLRKDSRQACLPAGRREWQKGENFAYASAVTTWCAKIKDLNLYIFALQSKIKLWE